jgi:DHA1 family inner membrane transport protein
MACSTVPSPPPVRGERLPRLALTVMAAAVFAAITTEVLPVGLLPIISQDLGTSQSNVGLLVSAYAVIVAVGSVPLAALVARWPRRRVLCVLLATYAVSNVVMATADDYWVALAARLLGGLAHAGFFGAVIAAAVSIVPVARSGKAVAFVGAGNALALALGVPLGTAVGTALGWRWAFAGCAVLMAVLAVLILLVLPAAQPAPARTDQTPLLSAVRGRPILIVAIMVAVLTLGHYTPYTYLSPLLRHAGVSAADVSLVLFGYGLAGVIGLVLSSRLVDRRPRKALGQATAATALCLLALGLVPGVVPAVIFVAAWGLAFGALPTLIQAVALRAVPESPDTAPAVVNSMFNVGIAGGALLGAGEVGFVTPPALALTGAALAASSLILLRAVGRAVDPDRTELSPANNP